MYSITASDIRYFIITTKQQFAPSCASASDSYAVFIVKIYRRALLYIFRYILEQEGLSVPNPQTISSLYSALPLDVQTELLALKPYLTNLDVWKDYALPQGEPPHIKLSALKDIYSCFDVVLRYVGE